MLGRHSAIVAIAFSTLNFKTSQDVSLGINFSAFHPAEK